MTNVKDTGPLTWHVPIVDAKTGRPTPEFQRRWEQQRSNNDLIRTITLGSEAPTGVPADGVEYINIAATPPILYVGSNGSWLVVGVVSFTDLTDVPSSYTGQGTKLVRVNVAETGLEFVAAATGANPTATASDVVVNGSASTFMRSDAAPAVQKASSSQFGIVKVDGTTITETGGVISASGGGGGGGGMTLISRVSPTATNTVTFSSIPTTYQDLKLIIHSRSTAAAATDVLNIRINSDSTVGNYEYQRLTGSAGVPSAANGVGLNAWQISTPAASTTAGIPAFWNLNIPTYNSTVFEKLSQAVDCEVLPSAVITERIWRWKSTAAINRIDVFYTTGNFFTGSVVSLYGIS